MQRAGRPKLKWEVMFGGALAYQGELVYEIVPVDVAV